MADALARMWVKFLPAIEGRVALLEAAVLPLEAGALDTEQRDAAHAAAHKLAGSLGTFGLHDGTELAREAELLLETDVTAAAASELDRIVRGLRAVIEMKKAAGAGQATS